MFTINNFVCAENLEQAFELNQNKANAVLGGILWLKMGSREIDTAIDLSRLGLNTIEETVHYFKIGCMTSLRDLEIHPGLNGCFNGYLACALEPIIGVQFRTGATIGGTVFSRFAFSDVLTALLALDTEVELWRGGTIPLAQFVNMPLDKDILVRVIIQKNRRSAAFMSQRISATDFPILNCAASHADGRWKIVLGARPKRAKLTEFTLSRPPAKADIEEWINHIGTTVDFGANARGSREYRQHLAGIMVERCIAAVSKGVAHEN